MLEPIPVLTRVCQGIAVADAHDVLVQEVERPRHLDKPVKMTPALEAIRVPSAGVFNYVTLQELLQQRDHLNVCAAPTGIKSHDTRNMHELLLHDCLSGFHTGFFAGGGGIYSVKIVPTTPTIIQTTPNVMQDSTLTISLLLEFGLAKKACYLLHACVLH